MARSKNSTPLFEVIRNAQQKQKEQQERQKRQELAAEMHAGSTASALLRSPMVWLKGKQAHQSAVDQTDPAVTAPAAPKPVQVAPPPTPRVDRPVFRELPDGVEKSTPVVVPKITPVPSAAEVAARQVREEMAAQEAPAAEPMFAGADYHQPFAADDDADAEPRRQINLQFNYTTAVIAGFAVLVTFVVAYVVGTAGHGEKAYANANGAVRRDVLNVQPNTPRSNTQPPAPSPKPVPDSGDLASLATGGESLAIETIGKPIPVPTDVKRIIGHQYLVLLSFPREQDAKDLVKFLAQNGVPATAEKALPEYAKSWTSVVTARGFDHTRNNPAYTAYSDTLKGLLQKYAGDSKFRKTFKIDVYTWRTAR